MGSRGSKQITAVKGAAERGQAVLRRFETYDDTVGTSALQCKGEQSVIGSNEEVAARPGRYRMPGAAHFRIHDGQMHGPLGEEACGRLQRHRRLQHVLRRDVVSEIHQARLGANAEHDPLHDADPGIARPEIGRECNDRHGH